MSAVPQEHSLVVTVRGLAAQAVQSEQVKRALEVAKNSRGIILASDAEAMENVDSTKLIVGGAKALGAAKDNVLAIPKAMVAAVNAVCKPLEDALAAGKKSRDDAALAYRQVKAAEFERERLRQQREVEALAQKAREQQALTNPFEDPEEEVVPLEIPTTPINPPSMVRGGSGSQVFSKVLTCELVNPHECDPSWLTLNNAAAKVWFRAKVKVGDCVDPGEGVEKAVTERGVRFWFSVSVGSR